VAATIAFLASEGAAYITGQSLRIDGGLIRSVWAARDGPDASAQRLPHFSGVVQLKL